MTNSWGEKRKENGEKENKKVYKVSCTKRRENVQNFTLNSGLLLAFKHKRCLYLSSFSMANLKECILIAIVRY